MSTYNRNEPQKSKAKLYLVIGIILGIIVAALLIWNSGIFQKNAVAATVGDQEFTIPQLSYYYNAQISNKRQEAQMYQQFGMTPDYNTDLAPEEQYYNEAEGVTYADYFLDQALNALKEDTILCTEAKNAGYTLSSAGEASIAENLDALHMYSTQSGYSESAYLKLLYGQYMTKSLFKEMLANSILANEYAQAKQAEFTYSDDELNTYYDEHKADLDTYEYRYCYISNQPETATDEDGNAVEPTEEETAAAQAAAQANAEAMVAAVQGGTPFNEAAQAAQDEESAENFKDEEYNHVTDLLGQNIDNTYKAWLQDEARTVGEVTSLETSAGYCVVQFLGREKSEDTYQTINYRNILVLSETTDTEVPVTDASAVTDGTADEAASTETETVSLPSAEQLAAAEEEANSLLEQFESGEQTAESFAALATANSDDEVTSANGGLTENANRDSLSSDLTEWLFAADRKAGDTTILDYKDSSGRVVGYQILYVDSLGDIAWRYAATTALQADDYQAWYTEVEGNYPAELTEKGKTIAGTPNVAEDAEAAEGTEAAEAADAVDETGEAVAEDAEAAVEETVEGEGEAEAEAEAEADAETDAESEGAAS